MLKDITMCNNDKCKLKHKCLRFVVTLSDLPHSYLAEPEKDCVGDNHEYFIGALD